jgi:AbrB family looped-hinge helix DNA binding protein
MPKHRSRPKDLGESLQHPPSPSDDTRDKDEISVHGEVRVRHGVNIGPGGRIVIPAEIRAALKVGEGDRLVLAVVGDELVVTPLWLSIERVQKWVRTFVPEGVSLVDELIADRRAEAAKEDEE